MCFAVIREVRFIAILNFHFQTLIEFATRQLLAHRADGLPDLFVLKGRP